MSDAAELSPADLFVVDVRTLGLKTVKPPGANPQWKTWWEWRKDDRLIFASVGSIDGVRMYGASCSFSGENLTDEQAAWFRALLREDLDWRRVTGRTYLALERPPPPQT